MLKIQVDPIVLAMLKKSFPKPANSAKRALDKYNAVFESVLNKANQIGRTRYEVIFDLYSLNLRQLSQKGPKIGGNTLRLHSWLIENDLLYYEVVEKGNNLSGVVSQVKLNSLITVENSNESIVKQLREAQTDAELDQVLDGDAERNREVFVNFYKDYYVYQTQAQLDEVFDQVPVDVKSLKAYIIWLNKKSYRLHHNIVRQRTDQAMEILCVALHTGGYFLQRKKLSEFGRTYYTGTSVQSVSKEFRAVMLGDSWELDLRSSVIAFKLGFAQVCADKNYSSVKARRLFSASYWYVEERNVFVNMMRKDIFGVDCDLSKEVQFALIKEALTAISFGARANSTGWRLKNGVWKNPALKEIFKNADWHENFLNVGVIKDFIAEQQMLDDFFYEEVQNTCPEILEQEFLKSGNKTSKSKVMSYIYQKRETEMMNFVRSELARIGKPVIASIHDAVVIKRELINDQLFDLNYCLRREFGNELLLLRLKKIEGYKRQSIEPEEDYDFEFPSVEELLKRLGYSSLQEYSMARNTTLQARAADRSDFQII